ncbi:hypothetical protein AYI68_g5419 [Smittium mucronatum]|uniref:Uncharacterized protein n=1 Tax=Smittium mucronatum TaxID=133383 RepID=A0A1R0GUG5_9FUNG|nr:hypothetical protein AYI68_g5419 [Smittium mucronatum]
MHERMLELKKKISEISQVQTVTDKKNPRNTLIEEKSSFQNIKSDLSSKIEYAGSPKKSSLETSNVAPFVQTSFGKIIRYDVLEKKKNIDTLSRRISSKQEQLRVAKVDSLGSGIKTISGAGLSNLSKVEDFGPKDHIVEFSESESESDHSLKWYD